MGRSDYIIRKAGFALITLAATIIFNFFLFRIMPGDPVQVVIPPRIPKKRSQNPLVWTNRFG